MTISLHKVVTTYNYNVLKKFNTNKLYDSSILQFSKYIRAIYGNMHDKTPAKYEIHENLESHPDNHENLENPDTQKDTKIINKEYVIIKCGDIEHKYDVKELTKYTYFRRCLDPKFDIKKDENENKIISLDEEYFSVMDILYNLIMKLDINYTLISKSRCIILITLLDYINEPDMIYDFIINKKQSFEDGIINIPISLLIDHITSIKEYFKDIIDEVVLSKKDNCVNTFSYINFISNIINMGPPTDRILTDIHKTYINKSIIEYVDIIFELFKEKDLSETTNIIYTKQTSNYNDYDVDDEEDTYTIIGKTINDHYMRAENKMTFVLDKRTVYFKAACYGGGYNVSKFKIPNRQNMGRIIGKTIKSLYKYDVKTGEEKDYMYIIKFTDDTDFKFHILNTTNGYYSGGLEIKYE